MILKYQVSTWNCYSGSSNDSTNFYPWVYYQKMYPQNENLLLFTLLQLARSIHVNIYQLTPA
jgi:hypothetical protein